MYSSLNAVIVEDDYYFTKVFITMLKENGHINILDSFCDGEKFLQALNNGLKPHAAFIDISLPGEIGTEIGKKIKSLQKNIQVVFVTGKPEYAVDAFDIEATDYLVKPFDEDRLDRCIQRLLKNARTLSNSKVYEIKTKNGITAVNINEIIFIEKRDSCTYFYTINGEYKNHETMDNIEKILQPEGFFRSHKSYLINPSYFWKTSKWGDRAYEIHFKLTDKVALLSRSKIKPFRKLIST